MQHQANQFFGQNCLLGHSSVSTFHRPGPDGCTSANQGFLSIVLHTPWIQNSGKQRHMLHLVCLRCHKPQLPPLHPCNLPELHEALPKALSHHPQPVFVFCFFLREREREKERDKKQRPVQSLLGGKSGLREQQAVELHQVLCELAHSPVFQGSSTTINKKKNQ